MKRCSMLCRVLAAVVLVAVSSRSLAAQRPEWVPPAPAYDVVIFKNVMVPVRDGTKLATDVYVPAQNAAVVPGKFPVLIARTPYDKNLSVDEASFLARQGYAVVVQDVRGRYASEGTFYIYLTEGKDGYDAVEWAAQQPWSNGSVATYGGSYLAGTQSALAVEHPPHLKAMFVTVNTANYHEDGAARAGAFYLLHNLAYVFNLGSTSKEALADPAIRAPLAWGFTGPGLAQWLRQYPFGANASPIRSAPAYDRWWQDWVDHPDYDDYWKQNGFTFDRYFDKYPDIPIYFGGGWYDIFLRGTLSSYTAFAKMHKSPTKMFIGPWQHGLGPRATGDVDYGPDAQVAIRNEMLRWFDAVLRNKDNGTLTEPPVRLFTMGGGSGARTLEGYIDHGGRWKFAPTWPAPGATGRTFYLHSDGSLNETAPAASAEPSVYTFDPRNPVPTIGGQINSGDQLVKPGAFDQRCSPRVFGCTDDLPLSARPDVRVFETPVLDHDVEVTGPISVTLFVSSDAKDTDFTAKLVDVYPSSRDYPTGYAMNIADRIVRVRYSRSTERPELLKAGEVREVTIDLIGTSNVFARGHRIRLDISSSNFPFFDVNPNTGERIGRHTRMQPATNTVFHDRDRPSRIVLPVLQSGTPARTSGSN